jgi:Sel1 repeat
MNGFTKILLLCVVLVTLQGNSHQVFGESSDFSKDSLYPNRGMGLGFARTETAIQQDINAIEPTKYSGNLWVEAITAKTFSSGWLRVMRLGSGSGTALFDSPNTVKVKKEKLQRLYGDAVGWDAVRYNFHTDMSEERAKYLIDDYNQQLRYKDIAENFEGDPTMNALLFGMVTLLAWLPALLCILALVLLVEYTIVGITKRPLFKTKTKRISYGAVIVIGINSMMNGTLNLYQGASVEEAWGLPIFQFVIELGLVLGVYFGIKALKHFVARASVMVNHIMLNMPNNIEWLQKSAEKGNMDAQLKLGLIYIKGEVIPQNYKKAHEWLEKPAEQGNSSAQFNLGVMYQEGQGIPQDYAKAIYWFQKSAEQGVAQAQSSLGSMYTLGQGVPIDFQKSYVWASLAVTQGEQKASELRQISAKRLTPAQLAEAQEWAKDWHEKIQAKKALASE